MQAEQIEIHREGQGSQLEDVIKELETLEERMLQEGYIPQHESIELDALKGNHIIHMLLSQEIEDAN